MEVFMIGRLLGFAAAVLMGTAATIAAQDASSLRATIKNTEGKEVGAARITETPHGIWLTLSLPANPPGIPPGVRALHIHEVGRCEPPFKSAGGHYNPLGKKHGFLDKAGSHAGDLPNLHVPENKPMTVEYFIPQLTIDRGKARLLDDDGSALVIHAKADDYKSDPAGDAGDRIACGIIERSK
jgi:Cu-Zn family superoxide dismutase